MKRKSLLQWSDIVRAVSIDLLMCCVITAAGALREDYWPKLPQFDGKPIVAHVLMDLIKIAKVSECVALLYMRCRARGISEHVLLRLVYPELFDESLYVKGEVIGQGAFGKIESASLKLSDDDAGFSERTTYVARLSRK